MAGLSRMTAFSTQQTQAALRATKAVSMIGMPLCMVQAAVAGPVLQALYGQKWVAAIPLVQWISVGMAFGVAAWPAGGLLQSRGQFRFFFYTSIGFLMIFMSLVYVGALVGAATGVAIAVCIFNVVCNPIFVAWVFRRSGVGWGEILNMNVRPLVVGLVAAGAATATVHFSESVGAHPIVQSAAATATGLIAMLIGARLIMPSSWHDVEARLRQVIRRPIQLNASRISA
jgi:O-antigen/teichoic acid export membrane protein